MIQFLSTWVAILTYLLFAGSIVSNNNYVKRVAYYMYPLVFSIMVIGIIITNFYIQIPYDKSIVIDLLLHIIPFVIIYSMKKEKSPIKESLLFYLMLGITYRSMYDPLKHYKNTPWYIIYIAFPLLLLYLRMP